MRPYYKPMRCWLMIMMLCLPANDTLDLCDMLEVALLVVSSISTS
jgi:hypothetical protein